MRRRFWAAGLLLVVSSSCSSKDDTEPGTSGEPGRYKAPPPMTIDATKTYKATVLTSKGTIELALDARSAPITVNNFVFLARERYYDGLVFHRVEPGFVVQGGDPSGTGSGGPGYTIDDEASPLRHDVGALGMAKSTAPNSAGSQFYITLSAQPSLDGRYTVFGKVAAGLDVAQKIAKGDSIQRITITEN